MSRKKSNGKGFTLGALVGGLLGGISALLFAPTSGEKIRKGIAKKCHRCCEKANETVDHICDQSSEMYKKTKGMAGNVKESAGKFLKRKNR